jgi:hypothetical protein
MARAAFSAAPFDQMIQDQFAAAIELAFSQATVDPLPPGHISLEEKVRGGTYAKWRRVAANGKPASPIYVGIVGSEPYEVAIAQKEELERIERMAKQLRKLGLATEDNASAVVLATLANAGFFRGGGVLVGTRAFRCLTNHLGYAVKPIVATQDVDIARPQAIALATPMPTGGLLTLLQGTGLRFVDVPGLSHSEPSTSWRVVGKEIKLDLLVPSSRQHKPYQAVAIRELGAHAIALEHLDYLLADCMDAVAIGKSQLVPVRVPMPARFCWHKLAVSQLRPTTLSAKANKDLIQAACLAVCLGLDAMDALIEARDAMPTAMRKLAVKAWPTFVSMLGNAHESISASMAFNAYRII